MPLSNSVKANIINILAGRQSSFSNSNVYVGLSTTTPSGDGTNITEPSDTYYKRVLIGNYEQNLTKKMTNATESNPESENADPILFDKASTSWGTITHVVFYDKQLGESNARFLGYSALTTSVTVGQGNVARIAAGDLTISIE